MKNNLNNAISKATVYLKVGGKTYKATTNSNGKATFKITELSKKGTYKATITYKGNTYYNYYASSNMKLVKRNQKLHNPDSPLLIGDIKESDVVKEVSEPSYIDTQQRLF